MDLTDLSLNMVIRGSCSPGKGKKTGQEKASESRRGKEKRHGKMRRAATGAGESVLVCAAREQYNYDHNWVCGALVTTY